MGSLLNQVGALVTKHTEKGTVTECLLCSVFISKAGLQESLSMKARVKVWENEDFPLVKEDQIRHLLIMPDIQKSTDPNKIHPRVSKELADVTAKPSSTLHHL